MDIYVVNRSGREYYYGTVYDDTDYSYKILDLNSDVVKWESFKYPKEVEAYFEDMLKHGYIQDYYKI